MKAANDSPRPSWASRWLAVACYFGLAPLLQLLRVGRSDEFFSHHRNQALTTLLLLLLVLLLYPLARSLELYCVLHYPGRPPDFMIAFFAGLGIWGLLSLLGMGMALTGSIRPVPLMTRLARSQWLMRVALIGNSVLMAFVVGVVGLTMHASSLVREDAVPAPVYFLYDSRDYEFLGSAGPKLNALFCYRVSRVARERWGPGKTVVAPMTAENFRTAIAHGRFVILTAHGQLGALGTVDGWSVWPDKVAMFGGGEDQRVVPVIGLVKPNLPTTAATPGKDLQFVYVSACDGGKLATEWEQRFAPAEVVTFNRISIDLEHLWWLWIDAPSRLRGLR